LLRASRIIIIIIIHIFAECFTPQISIFLGSIVLQIFSRYNLWYV